MENKQVNTKTPTGLVLNIQHFCTHDGPGIRTTVFLKACSLRCKWCSNPESIHPKPELAYNPGKCIGEKQCGFCLKNVCPESAIYVVGSGDRPDDKVRINWDLCTNCGKCVPVCPTNALYLFGQEMTVDQVLDEVEQDSTFYRESGGGMTVSGGECQLQADFLAALLAGAHRARNQHGNRNGEQCTMGFHGKGPASCRHRAPRHQADRSGASQEVVRGRQHAHPCQPQTSLRDISR